MTNNNNITFNPAAFSDAKAALEAAQNQMNAVKEAAKNFMVEYINSKEGEAVATKELSEKTGLSPTAVGIMLSHNMRICKKAYKTKKRFIELDENNNPVPGTEREFTLYSHGYCAGRKYW